jgi:geranylgeranyl reductase family protein
MGDRESRDPVQLGASEIPDGPWDVAVIGGGPSGSTAARLLASHGCSVLLLDEKPFPREKVCGDALLGDALVCLGRAGLLTEVSAHAFAPSGVRVFSRARHEVALSGKVLTVKRATLDLLLARAAVAKGAVFGHARAAGISDDAARGPLVTLEGRSAPVRARVVLLATGANVALAGRLGLVRRERPTAVAARRYVRSRVEIREMVISYDHAILPGYGWIFPLGGGEYNVGCGHVLDGGPPPNLRVTYEAFRDRFPLCRELVGASEEASVLRGATLRCGLAGAVRKKGGAVLAIGETLGTTLPFTGEGIGKAMESGELAASVVFGALDAGRLDSLGEYPERLERELKPRYGSYEKAQRYLSKPWLNDLVIRRAAKSRKLREAFGGIIGEDSDPRDVFSVWGLVKSFVRQ